jgi:hypothetical protein
MKSCWTTSSAVGFGGERCGCPASDAERGSAARTALKRRRRRLRKGVRAGDWGKLLRVEDVPRPAFICSAHGRIQGLHTIGRPGEDAGGASELASSGDLARGSCRGWPAAAPYDVDEQRFPWPVNRRHGPAEGEPEPRETGARRPPSRSAVPLPGLGEICDWRAGDAAVARKWAETRGWGDGAAPAGTRLGVAGKGQEPQMDTSEDRGWSSGVTETGASWIRFHLPEMNRLRSVGTWKNSRLHKLNINCFREYKKTQQLTLIWHRGSLGLEMDRISFVSPHNLFVCSNVFLIKFQHRSFTNSKAHVCLRS